MRASPLFVLALTCLSLQAQAARTTTFRQWIGGQEVGGASIEVREATGLSEVRSREWMALSRMGQKIKQEVLETASRRPDGQLSFTWRLSLSAEPFEGKATWSPREPGVLLVQPNQGPALRKEIPVGAVLWPEEMETRLKDAARHRRSIDATSFSFPLQQWGSLHLEPKGPAPLPGFPDAVRFQGEEREGSMASKVEVWISPTAGELKRQGEVGGMPVLTQRTELPPPQVTGSLGAGFFERTLLTLPPHPFLLWIPDLTLHAEGPLPKLPEDAQQQRLPQGRWRLRRAALPTAAEARQLPVSGSAATEDARYLAPSSLVQFQDPAFEGLLRRMALPSGLPRWELARRVTSFVFEWITEKDYTVGFASALEVCHTPRGDCTEHGVLAVALLRRLGVPARGVTGWVGLGKVLGLHFWVEVRLGNRWVPIDPTFDQAPASALRIKLGDTDLADLGSVQWEGVVNDFSQTRWVPEREGGRTWKDAITIQGDTITAPGGLQLRLPGGRWSLLKGELRLSSGGMGPWRFQASTRPWEAQLKGALRLAGPNSLRTGWWRQDLRTLWVDLGQGHWLQVESVSDREAYDLLDQLMAATSDS